MLSYRYPLLGYVHVPGAPKAQGSLRSFMHPRTGRVVTPQNQRVLDWRGRVAVAAREENPHLFISEGAVALELELGLPRPKSAPKTRWRGWQLAAKRPDIDKLVRALLDGLTDVWFRDDSQVVRIDVSKVVVPHGGAPGAVAAMYDMREADCQVGEVSAWAGVESIDQPMPPAAQQEML